MTEQEQKAFEQMREALEEIICANPVPRTKRQVYAIVAGRNALTAANAANKFEAARSKREITDEMLNFGARGLLASLTFWPHMTEEDSDELADFLAKYMRRIATNAVQQK